MGVTTGPDGRIYVLGGVAAQPQPDVTSVAGLSTVFIYDPGTRRWSRGKPMPDGRYNLAAVTGKDGRIYTIGGATICYDLCAGTGTVRAFNPRTNTWTTLAPLPVSCLPPAAAVAPDGRIYVFGCAPPSDSFLVYDPTRNRWTKVAGMPHRRFSGFAAATAGDGRIVLAGGCLITSATQSGFNGYCGSPSPVDAYDPRTNRWQTIGLTLNARRWPAATTGPDGRVYVVGGSGDGNGKLLEVIRSGRSG
jgi:N-acetylneuraminic acid mutarotase